jgi:hypothetical protein
VFWKKRLQTIENKGREGEKEREERYKRLQLLRTWDLPQRHGDTEAEKA